MERCAERQDDRCAEPCHRPGHRPGCSCRYRRSGPGPGGPATRLRRVALGAGQRAGADHAQGGAVGSRACRRHRAVADSGAGQADCRVAGGGQLRRRYHRMVRRRRAAGLWSSRPIAQRCGAADRGARAGRPGRGVHPVELPGQPGGAQALCRTGHRLFLPGQGPRGNPGVASRLADALPIWGWSGWYSAIRHRFPPT